MVHRRDRFECGLTENGSHGKRIGPNLLTKEGSRVTLVVRSTPSGSEAQRHRAYGRRHAFVESAHEWTPGATFDAPVALCAHLGYLWTLRWLPPVHLSITSRESVTF